MGKRGGPSLHAFIMREAASTGQPKDRLTKAQRALLTELSFREEVFARGAQIRAARRLVVLGMARVARLGATGELYAITPAGRAALEATEPKGVE